MNIGDSWSVIHADPKTSAPLPEALWYQELERGAKPPGLFVSLLQRYDVALDGPQSKSVFYQVSPFPESKIPSHQFRFRLPRQLAVYDEVGHDHSNVGGTRPTSTDSGFSAPTQMSSLPRMQKRRVPLLARFTDNQKVIFMQFSSTYVRVAVPETDSRTVSSTCQHWTIELKACVNDPYTPVESLPEEFPRIKIPSSLRTNTAGTLEIILPGGIFWLDQSFGTAKGSDYQEYLLVVSTTRALLCYTVTFDCVKATKTTLTMRLRHRFSHDIASVAWWSPESLTLVVGSYKSQQQLFCKPYFFSSNGPFTSQQEVLRNPLLLPLRLERPPPVQGNAFLVGNCIQNASKKLPLNCIALVHLYGKPFVVEIAAETTLAVPGEHCLGLSLHELDSENGTVNTGKITQQVVFPRSIVSSEEDILVTTLDNVLCISFRQSKLHLFLDILDVDLGCNFVVEKFATEEENEHLQPVIPILFVSPGHLFLPQRGLMVPISLNLERLAPSASAYHRCNFSMLVRRTQTQGLSGRQIALSRFSAIVALPTASARLKWIDHVSAMYARHTNVNAIPHESRILLWDLQSTLHLMHQCALLPCGTEFMISIDDCSDRNLLDNLAAPKLPANDAILQSDLLTSLFLPRARKVLSDYSGREKGMDDSFLLLRRLAELSLFYRGALEHHGSMTCPALECFVFAILWRLGDASTLSALLKSRVRSFTELFKCKWPKHKQTIAYLSIKWQAKWLMAIVSTVEYGSLSTTTYHQESSEISALRRQCIQLCLFMLSASVDYRLPADRISHLLAQCRLMDAMKTASLLIEASDEQNQPSGNQQNGPSAALIHAKSNNPGEAFLEIAKKELAVSFRKRTSATLCRLLQSVDSFLVKWDPDCLKKAVLEAQKQKKLTKDDMDCCGAWLPPSKRNRLQRRSSWIASLRNKSSSLLNTTILGNYKTEPSKYWSSEEVTINGEKIGMKVPSRIASIYF